MHPRQVENPGHQVTVKCCKGTAESVYNLLGSGDEVCYMPEGIGVVDLDDGIVRKDENLRSIRVPTVNDSLTDALAISADFLNGFGTVSTFIAEMLCLFNLFLYNSKESFPVDFH